MRPLTSNLNNSTLSGDTHERIQVRSFGVGIAFTLTVTLAWGSGGSVGVEIATMLIVVGASGAPFAPTTSCRTLSRYFEGMAPLSRKISSVSLYSGIRSRLPASVTGLSTPR